MSTDGIPENQDSGPLFGSGLSGGLGLAPERAEFEKWARKYQHFNFERRNPPNQEQYDDFATGDAWSSWTAAVSVERERWLAVVTHAVTELESLDDETAQAQAAAMRELLGTNKSGIAA